MDRTVITRDMVKSLYESKYVKVFDLQYEEGMHYYDATRRDAENLVAVKSDEEFRSMLPDAVSCFVIIRPDSRAEDSTGERNLSEIEANDGLGSESIMSVEPDRWSGGDAGSRSVSQDEGDEGCLDLEPRLLLTKEFRYPAGRYLLSVPAGLLDEEDACVNAEAKRTGFVPEEPLLRAAAREIHEETGLTISSEAGDILSVVDPFVFSTPGMSDESNALISAVLKRDLNNLGLTDAGAVGSEKFDGFCLITLSEAREILRTGRDRDGFFLPVYTWMALMYFLSGMWK